MQWIYILRCEGNIIYVGETKNLYSRLYQHINGGCTTTKKHKVLELLGLYKVTVNYNFLMYIREIYNYRVVLEKKIENMREYLFNMDNYSLCRDHSLCVENFVTEKMMDDSEFSDSHTVYGGMYTKDVMRNQKRIFDDVIYDRPMCPCGIPVEIKKIVNGKKVKILCICSMKNVWDKMRDDIKDIKMAKPCNYYKEFLDDIELRVLL